MTQGPIGNGVILAENDALLRGVIRSLLLHAGQKTFLAADGVEAVALARQFTARLVLLDIGMPHLNGLLACNEIRSLPSYAEVPIVILTGYNHERMRRAATQVGANDFITKPFRPDELLKRIAPFLGLAGALPPVMSDEGSGYNVVSGQPRIWDRPKVLGATYGEDPESASGREVLRIYRDAERNSR